MKYMDLGEEVRRIVRLGHGEALKEMSAKEGELRAMLEHAVALCVLDPTCRKCCEEAMAGSGGAGRSVFNDSEEAFTRLCELGPEQLTDEELLDLVVDPEALASVSEVLIGGSGDDVWLLELLHKNAVGNDPEKIDERIFEDLMPAGPMPKWLRRVAEEAHGEGETSVAPNTRIEKGVGRFRCELLVGIACDAGGVRFAKVESLGDDEFDLEVVKHGEEPWLMTVVHCKLSPGALLRIQFIDRDSQQELKHRFAMLRKFGERSQAVFRIPDGCENCECVITDVAAEEIRATDAGTLLEGFRESLVDDWHAKKRWQVFAKNSLEQAAGDLSSELQTVFESIANCDDGAQGYAA